MWKSLAIVTALLASGPACAKDFWVAPDGRADGSGTRSHPFASIQAAVNVAGPGDNVRLEPGLYLQDVVTVRNGAPGKPIVITGDQDAVVSGGGRSRIFEIRHDWITLTGFTVDGWWDRSSRTAKAYRNKLIYALSPIPNNGVKNLVINGMWLQNAGGECIRLRYLVSYSQIRNSRISHCGIYAFKLGLGGKNGEGIYLGTAPEQRADGTNPNKAVDASYRNLIAYNIIDTWGNECVDIKEGATDNRVERNTCTGQRDPDSAAFDSRGSGNIFRDNVAVGNTGAGIRLGGDGKADGTGNIASGNILLSNGGGAFKITRAPQALICGNTVPSGSLIAALLNLDPAKACP